MGSDDSKLPSHDHNDSKTQLGALYGEAGVSIAITCGTKHLQSHHRLTWQFWNKQTFMSMIDSREITPAFFHVW